MRKRLVHIIPTLDQGGAEKQLCLLCAHLDRTKFDVHVIVLTRSGPRRSFLDQAGIPVHEINKRHKLDPWAIGRLRAKLAELKPDIVHTWLFAANSYGRWIAQGQNIPVVIAGERSVDPWKTWWHLAIDRWLLRKTTAVITNTSAVTEFYRSRRLTTDKFHVIPNAVEPYAGKRITKAEAFQRLGIEPRDKLVIAVGRLWPQKGYRDLVWSGELLHVAYPDVWVVIVGDGPERERLMEFRDHVRSDDAVKFAGARTDALELMSAADVLWNGSLYEGQSNTILEAMSLGLPVVASDIPGNRDLVIHDETGYLFQLGDVAHLTRWTNRLLRDPELASRLGQAGLARTLDEFSLQKMIERHETLYASVQPT